MAAGRKGWRAVFAVLIFGCAHASGDSSGGTGKSADVDALATGQIGLAAWMMYAFRRAQLATERAGHTHARSPTAR